MQLIPCHCDYIITACDSHTLIMSSLGLLYPDVCAIKGFPEGTAPSSRLICHINCYMVHVPMSWCRMGYVHQPAGPMKMRSMHHQEHHQWHQAQTEQAKAEHQSRKDRYAGHFNTV